MLPIRFWPRLTWIGRGPSTSRSSVTSWASRQILPTTSGLGFDHVFCLWWKTTGWSNWVILRKLKYFTCCLRSLFLFLVCHLSNSIYNTSISGVKSSCTSLYVTPVMGLRYVWNFRALHWFDKKKLYWLLTDFLTAFKISIFVCMTKSCRMFAPIHWTLAWCSFIRSLAPSFHEYLNSVEVISLHSRSTRLAYLSLAHNQSPAM